MKSGLIYCILSLFLIVSIISCSDSYSVQDGVENLNGAKNLKSGTTLSAPKTKVRDLVLIYGAGTEKGQQWDYYAFHPYVVHKNEQQQYDWMFDGFLFLELSDDWDFSFTVGHGDPAKPAQKANWNTLLDKYFTQGCSLHALDQAIDDATWSVGQPPSKRKIVIGIPEPLEAVSINWGMADGIWLDFQYESHRAAACRWFINQAETRFNSANFRHLELDGFYWIGEAVENNPNVTLEVSNYLATKDYSFTWIPWWNSPGYETPNQFGFSDTYLQPNYFFYDYVPYSRLQSACDEAFSNNIYLEMEFDDNVLYFDSYREKMYQYMDVFRQNNVYSSMKLTYYQAQNTILHLFTQKEYHPHLDTLYNKFCKIVTDRQKVQNPSYMD